MFGESIDLPDEYIHLFDAHMKLKKYSSKDDMYLNREFKVSNSTQLRIAVAGDDDALSAAQFINTFMKKDDDNGGEEVQEQLSL